VDHQEGVVEIGVHYLLRLLRLPRLRQLLHLRLLRLLQLLLRLPGVLITSVLVKVEQHSSLVKRRKKIVVNNHEVLGHFVSRVLV